MCTRSGMVTASRNTLILIKKRKWRQPSEPTIREQDAHFMFAPVIFTRTKQFNLFTETKIFQDNKVLFLLRTLKTDLVMEYFKDFLMEEFNVGQHIIKLLPNPPIAEIFVFNKKSAFKTIKKSRYGIRHIFRGLKLIEFKKKAISIQ